MSEEESYSELEKNYPRLNKTSLLARITSVSANPACNEILLGLEAITDSSPPFKAFASIPCTNGHLASETVWYAKLWKKGRLILFEGSFRFNDGLLTMIAPDITPVTKRGKPSGVNRKPEESD